jgi:hypothetical protein
MLVHPALGMVGLLAGLLSACQSGSLGLKEAEGAIIAQERRALEQWAKGNPLGYLDVDAEDVTYFDDIGAHSLVDGIGAMDVPHLIKGEDSAPPLRGPGSQRPALWGHRHPYAALRRLWGRCPTRVPLESHLSVPPDG